MRSTRFIPVAVLALAAACNDINDTTTGPTSTPTSGPPQFVAATSVTQTGGLHVCQGTLLDVTATSTDEGKILTASGEVCGAGPTATATLSATATATVGCITPPRSNEPRGLQDVSTATTASEEFDTRQGRATFAVPTEPLSIEDFDFACPSPNMVEVLVGPVTFTGITLTITSQTGTITATFPDLDP
jgi:hypothetical protein